MNRLRQSAKPSTKFEARPKTKSEGLKQFQKLKGSSLINFTLPIDEVAKPKTETNTQRIIKYSAIQ